MFGCIIFIFIFGLGVANCDHAEYNTTAAATNIESTIGTPATFINPTITSSQNTTDGQYEVRSILFIN